jgi:hypothetical protein
MINIFLENISSNIPVYSRNIPVYSSNIPVYSSKATATECIVNLLMHANKT